MRNGRLAKWSAIISLGLWLGGCSVTTEAAPVETAETVLQKITETVYPIPTGLDNSELYHQFSSTETMARFEYSPLVNS